MKKNDLLKVLGISFLVVLLLSWVIPAGVYSSGAYQALGSTAPIGLYDIFRTPLITIATFIQYGLLFLVIGGFYGVLNKTESYSKLIDKIVKKVNKKVFLFITIGIFASLSSLTGMLNLLFVLVPFFTAVLLKYGYNKLNTFASTIGSMLLGQIGCILGFNIWGYLSLAFGLDMTTLLLARIILFLVITILFMLFINSKLRVDKTKNSDITIPLYEEKKGKKSFVPLIVIFSITFVLLFVGLYDWNAAFNISIFNELDQAVLSFQIDGYPILSNLLGTVSPFGSFNNYDVITVLIIATLVVSWIYSIKFKDTLASFVEGAKEMIVPSVYAMLSCIIFTSIMNLENGNFLATIVNNFTGEKFSLFGTVGSSSLISFVYNDFYYVLANFYGAFSLYDAAVMPIIALVFQTMYGLVMLIAPTSLFLLAGLSYLEIPYKDWMKYIWKFFLILLVVVLIFVIMMNGLI